MKHLPGSLYNARSSAAVILIVDNSCVKLYHLFIDSDIKQFLSYIIIIYNSNECVASIKSNDMKMKCCVYSFFIKLMQKMGSFCARAQPMRDDVCYILMLTLIGWVHTPGCIHKMIPGTQRVNADHKLWQLINISCENALS